MGEEIEAEKWTEAQKLERAWWGTCVNTFGEEVKQTLYANKMGLKVYDNGDSPFVIETKGKKILDIGSGPVSMLLKADKLGQGVVVDPCDYPKWTYDRYVDNGIIVGKFPAEDLLEDEFISKIPFDEAWIYNCLQHTKEPEKIIQNAKAVAKTIRIFEWIDHETNAMHPHRLTEKDLDSWLIIDSTITKHNVEDLNELGCVGKAYYGVFTY